MTDDANSRFEELEARVRRLESDLAQLRADGSSAGITTSPPPPLGQLPNLSGASPPPPPPPPPTSPRPTTPLAAQPGVTVESEAILKWGGVGLVVLAVGFAVSTAISRGWIGPGLQLAGAVAFSLALVAVGWRLRTTRLPWSHALCAGGVAALFTTVASDLFVNEINRDVAFVATIGIGIGGYGLARLVPSEWVGVTALSGGMIGWLVIGDGDPGFGPTLGWFAVIVTAAVIVSLEQRWFGLRLLAHLAGMGALLGLAGEVDTGGNEIAALVGAALMSISLLRVPSIGNLESPWQELEIRLAAVAGPWAFAVIVVTLDLDADTALGWTAISVAVVTTTLAVGIRPLIRFAHLVSLLLGASVSLTIGLGFLLSTDVVFVALAVQGAGLIMLSRMLRHDIVVMINAGVLLFVAAVYALVSGVDAWTIDAPIGDDIARFAIIVMVGLGLWQTRNEPVRRLGAGAVLAIVLVWLGSVLVHLPEGQAVVSVSWAMVGTAILVAGAVRKVPDLGSVGLTVLAFTVAKLLVVDMREVDTLWRAGLFLLVGLAIMRLGFLLPKLTGAGDKGEGASRDPRTSVESL